MVLKKHHGTGRPGWDFVLGDVHSAAGPVERRHLTGWRRAPSPSIFSIPAKYFIRAKGPTDPAHRTCVVLLWIWLARGWEQGMPLTIGKREGVPLAVGEKGKGIFSLPSLFLLL